MTHTVTQPYCDHDLQIIHQTMYIVGETKQYEPFQDAEKLLLLDVWAQYTGHLPDVDMLVQFDDWMPPNLSGAKPAPHSFKFSHRRRLKRAPSFSPFSIADRTRDQLTQLALHTPF